jgi:hypothetical protein
MVVHTSRGVKRQWQGENWCKCQAHEGQTGEDYAHHSVNACSARLLYSGYKKRLAFSKRGVANPLPIVTSPGCGGFGLCERQEIAKLFEFANQSV